MVCVIWDFQGREGNSYRDREANVWKINLCWVTLKQWDTHGEDCDQMYLARFLPVYHTLVYIKLLSMMISPFVEQVLYLNTFRQ